MADQEARQARYPYDRIAFVPSAAAADSKDLNDYKYGLISFDTLRAHIAYKKIARHLFLSRQDLISDLVLVEQAHEKTIRKAYGLQAKVDRLEEENNTYRHKLYKRGKGDYR